MHANETWERYAEASDVIGLSDLRRHTIVEIGVVMFVLAWIIMVASISYQGRVEGLLIAGLLFGGVAGIIWLRQQRLRLAIALLVVSLTGAIAIEKSLFPNSAAQFYYPVVVVACSLLVSSARNVFGIASVASASCLAVARSQGADWLNYEQIGFPIFLNYLTAFAALLGSRQMRIALGWMQSSYTRANHLLDQLRDERLHLARTLKALEDAYYRITRLNYALIEARSAAEAARRLKAEFAANISHELRTPLNLIIGFSETMANAPETYSRVVWSPTLRGDIEQIYRSSRHLSGLIDDILDLSALEAQQLGLTVEEMDIQEVIEEAVAVVRDLYQAKHLYLNVETAPALPCIRIDPIRIRQVLLNLLTNAIRFTREGGVTITTRLVDRAIQVAVADTGIGIAAQDVARVFEEFGQVDGATSRKQEGTGLGIPLSKRLVELHGGQLWLESQPGIGTTFFFTLPVAPTGRQPRLTRPASDARRDAAQPAAPAPEYRSALLVAEPDPLLLRTIRRHISAYDVIEVSDADDLPALIGQHQPVALIVDTPGQPDASMPPRWAERLPPDLPLVTLSMPGSLKSAQALGIHSYLIKPISRDQLNDTLADLEQDVHTILIVDDDAELVDLLNRMLQSFGRDYRLLRAYQGLEALALLHQEQVDLVLLDLIMPNFGGMDVLRAMKQDDALARIPVVVISAQQPEEAGPDTGLFLQAVRARNTSITEVLTCLKAVVDGLPRPEPSGFGVAPASPAVPGDLPAS
jgi:signal transduction histidine kinase/CheY-like chemotaxis protein